MSVSEHAPGIPGLPVAVLEDNPGLLEDLLYSLHQHGCDTRGFSHGAGLDAAIALGELFKVLVLDLGLPGEDGMSIARRLRSSQPDLGIVMLTARTTVNDRIAGFDAGADVYMTKPVDLHELAAAVLAIGRRVGRIAKPHPTETAWDLDSDALELRRPDGERIRLTPSEAQILHAFAARRDRKLSRLALISAIGRNPHSFNEHTLEVMVSRLRSKLGPEAPLRAMRNKGYAFTAPLAIKSRI